MDALKDDDIMPFGKYKGRKMKAVPASWLCWFWAQSPGAAKQVVDYIQRNMSALKKEHEDGIWDTK